MTGFKEKNKDLNSYPGGRVMMIIKHYGLNRNSFSLKIGMGSNSLITRLTNSPDMGMHLELIQKILRACPEINPEWFILGEGDMLKGKGFPDKRTHYIKYCKVHSDEPFDLMRITGFEDCDYAFDLVGTGMTPRYRSGDILICKSVDLTDKVIYGEAYMIVADHSIILRYIKSKIEETGYKLGAEDARYEDSSIDLKDIQHLYLAKGVVRKELF